MSLHFIEWRNWPRSLGRGSLGFRRAVVVAVAAAGLVLAPAGGAALAAVRPQTVAGLALFQDTTPGGRVIYSETANAKADIAAAEVTARKYHRNILLDFGGNWCGDCQVLDIYMHRSPNQELVAKNFVVVHVDIGRYDKNVDLAKKYGIPLAKGVPALAVLSPTGRMLYSQKQGEFENMRNMDPASLTAFLTKWKPAQ